jgi:hypothetical protein
MHKKTANSKCGHCRDTTKLLQISSQWIERLKPETRRNLEAQAPCQKQEHRTQQSRAFICQTCARDPSQKSPTQQILLDLGFVAQKLEDAVDLHRDEPASMELALLMLAAPNGSETCQAPLPHHRWDRLALRWAPPSQYKAMVVKSL